MGDSELRPRERKQALMAKAPAEVLALAQQEGYELTDEELDQVTGGAWGNEDNTTLRCPTCGSENVEPQGMHSYRCLVCAKVFSA